MIYQSERYMPESSPDSLVYTFSLTNGAYDIALHFAEIYFTYSGARIFSIEIQGVLLLTEFDIDDIVEHDTATTLIYDDIGVEDGTLTIELTRGSVHNPKISGIEIVEDVVASLPITKFCINVGYTGSTDYVDSTGNEWIPDDYYTSLGSIEVSATDDITNTDDIIYQTQRTFASNSQSTSLTYDIPVRNGVYDVTLYFAEIVETSSGQRVMDFTMEDTLIQSYYDIFGSTGHDIATSIEKTGDATTGLPVISGICYKQTAYHFAHAVINADEPEIIQFEELDDDGSVFVDMAGYLSHTHFPGAVLTTWEWSWILKTDNNVFGAANGENINDVSVDVGSYD